MEFGVFVYWVAERVHLKGRRACQHTIADAITGNAKGWSVLQTGPTRAFAVRLNPVPSENTGGFVRGLPGSVVPGLALACLSIFIACC